MPLDEDVTRLAKGKNLATVVTLMPNGQPQALLTWVDADDEHVLVNTEPQRQRARNVARDPRITVLIRSEDDPYDWAEVRGHVAETVTGDEARRHIDELSRKYTGHDYAAPVGPGEAFPAGEAGTGSGGRNDHDENRRVTLFACLLAGRRRWPRDRETRGQQARGATAASWRLIPTASEWWRRLKPRSWRAG